jgi:hypothetical protein
MLLWKKLPIQFDSIKAEVSKDRIPDFQLDELCITGLNLKFSINRETLRSLFENTFIDNDIGGRAHEKGLVEVLDFGSFEIEDDISKSS